MSEIVVAVASTTVFIDSQRVHILQGSAWAADSPAVRKYPENFSSDPARALGLDLLPPVEQKTAAPGEKSNVVRRTK